MARNAAYQLGELGADLDFAASGAYRLLVGGPDDEDDQGDKADKKRRPLFSFEEMFKLKSDDPDSLKLLDKTSQQLQKCLLKGPRSIGDAFVMMKVFDMIEGRLMP